MQVVPEVISPKEARAQGLTRYFTGKPCPRGHIAERIVSTRACSLCLRQKRRQWDLDNPDKLSVRQAGYYRNRPGYREKVIAATARWARDHPEETNASKTRYRLANPAKTRAAIKRSMAKKRDYYRAVNQADKNLRRVGRSKPSWADRKAIRTFFAGRPAGMTIDHIVPLKGRTVEGYRISGLHVVWNLQYLPLTENVRKNLRMRPEDQALCEV